MYLSLAFHLHLFPAIVIRPHEAEWSNSLRSETAEPNPKRRSRVASRWQDGVLLRDRSSKLSAPEPIYV